MVTAPRHQCFIYDGPPSAHLSHIAQSLVQKLRANHRCLYLNTPAMVAGMRSHLAAMGLNPRAETERGALVLSSDQGHLVDGKFDVERMLGVAPRCRSRRACGWLRGLRASGDMTWEFGNESNLDKLLAYERRLEAFMRANPELSGICLYHRDTLPPHAIATALATHPALFVSATLSQLNPRYQPAPVA